MARDGDAAAVGALARELALHVADPDPGLDSHAWFKLGFGEDKWFACLVAEIDSGIVGFASYCRRFEAHTRSRALWLGDLVVARSYRGRGIGQPAGLTTDLLLKRGFPLDWAEQRRVFDSL